MRIVCTCVFRINWCCHPWTYTHVSHLRLSYHYFCFIAKIVKIHTGNYKIVRSSVLFLFLLHLSRPLHLNWVFMILVTSSSSAVSHRHSVNHYWLTALVTEHNRGKHCICSTWMSTGMAGTQGVCGGGQCLMSQDSGKQMLYKMRNIGTLFERIQMLLWKVDVILT